MSAPLLEVRGLNVWLRPPGHKPALHVLRDVSLRVDAGKRLGLVGESGCGKTTTLLSMIGLLPINARVSGAIALNGVELITSSEGTKRLDAQRGTTITMVMQSSLNALNPVKRVDDQIREAMRRETRSSRARSEARCRELLERVSLPRGTARAFPHELSGGMRQRVAIAMALAPEPKVILADEPTTALDTIVQARIMELLDELCREMDLSVVLVSHHLALAAAFCDTVAVMYGGRVVEYDTSHALCDGPSHPYTQLLFAATPRLGSGKEEMKSIPGAPPALTDPDEERCAFEPRCPAALDCCMTHRPALQALGTGGSAACHRLGAEE